MSEARGYRGYIGSRPYFGQRTPQHVQNLVVRDYCRRLGVEYMLSVTEYAMPGCFIMLEEALRELPQLGGIVLYSLFMLPEAKDRRRALYDRVLGQGVSLHGAVEGMAMANEADIARVEDIWAVHQLTWTRAEP